MILPHSVSLRDTDATRDELEALRGVMRSDEPYFDEPPVFEDIYSPPSDADEAWYAAVHLADPFAERNPVGGWEDLDVEPDPSPTPSGGWDLPNGFFGHQREEP